MDGFMLALLQRLMVGCVSIGCCLGISACAPGLDDTQSLQTLQSAKEGIVFLQLAYHGIPCRNGNVALATEPSPGRFQLYNTLMVGGLLRSASMTSRQVSLPAGTYHVGYVSCQPVTDLSYTLGVGEQDGTVFIGNPLQSLAHFTVGPGEVVNLGRIDLLPADYLANDAKISITDVDADALQRLRSGVPTLASVMVTRLMTPTSPGKSYKIARARIGNG